MVGEWSPDLGIQVKDIFSNVWDNPSGDGIVGVKRNRARFCALTGDVIDRTASEAYTHLESSVDGQEQNRTQESLVRLRQIFPEIHKVFERHSDTWLSSQRSFPPAP